MDRQHIAARGSRTHSVSSSYQDLVLAVGNRTITGKGNTRFDHVQSLLAVHEDGRFSCKICGHESHDRINLVVHKGILHGALRATPVVTNALEYALSKNTTSS